MKIAEIILILGNIFFLVINQFLSKQGAILLKENSQWNGFSSGYALLICAYLTFFIRAYLWIKLVNKIPLSVAYPMLSLSFIFILLISYFYFAEPTSLIKMIGAVCIICGTAIIGNEHAKNT
jgi:multidrug transporter EmrE-like cation transporter